MLNLYVITIFPEPIKSYLGESILKKAIENKKISVDFYNPLD
jgi:tRNA (guanine37-N1)-methyltransferase